MRVLHLTDHYPPALGGIEAHVSALALRQAQRGDDVEVLTSTSAINDGRYAADTGPVTVHRVRSALERLPIDLTSYDVVHAHLSVVAPFTAPVAALAARRGAPTLVTVHSLWSRMGPIPSLAAQLSGLRGAPVSWTAVSRIAAAQLRPHLPARAAVGVLPNAVDVAPRAATPPTDDDGTVRLVSTMRIARRKRPEQLLRIFRAVQASAQTPVSLTIVGDGPLRSRIERHSAGNGGVTVTGRVEPAEVMRLLADAHVYVAPAVLESFGLAALEARCVGLPVVGRSNSGVTEFVRDGVEGLLAGSDAEMADQLRILADDAALRAQVSEHNRTIASPMTWDNAMTLHDQAYVAAGARTWGRAGAPLQMSRDR